MLDRKDTAGMTGMRLLRLLAIVDLVLIAISLAHFVAISLAHFVGASYPTNSQLYLSLAEPGTQLLLVTASNLGFATGIAALLVVAQQRRWGWLVAMLLLVLAHMYVPVVVWTIGPTSQRWWYLFLYGPQQHYLIVYLASMLGPAALTALVSVVLSLGKGPATLAREHRDGDVPGQRTSPPISASQGTPGQ